MKKINLTKGKSVLIDDEDYELVNKWRWCFDTGYAARKIGPKKSQVKIWMHRMIMNTPPGMDTDHINRDGLDNRKKNLRVVSHSVNLNNSKLRVDNKSGVKGVSWSKDKQKWRATKTTPNKQYHLGYFNSLKEATESFNSFNKMIGGPNSC